MLVEIHVFVVLLVLPCFAAIGSLPTPVARWMTNDQVLDVTGSDGYLRGQSSAEYHVGALFKREDACEVAFGKGDRVDVCTPSSTICCVREEESWPRCEQYLSLGWCCTGK